MAVFSRRMQKLSAKDIPGSLRTVEDYIRYMQESIERAVRPMREVQALEEENAALQAEVLRLNEIISALTSD